MQTNILQFTAEAPKSLFVYIKKDYCTNNILGVYIYLFFLWFPPWRNYSIVSEIIFVKKKNFHETLQWQWRQTLTFKCCYILQWSIFSRHFAVTITEWNNVSKAYTNDRSQGGSNPSADIYLKILFLLSFRSNIPLLPPKKKPSCGLVYTVLTVQLEHNFGT